MAYDPPRKEVAFVEWRCCSPPRRWMPCWRISLPWWGAIRETRGPLQASCVCNPRISHLDLSDTVVTCEMGMGHYQRKIKIGQVDIMTTVITQRYHLFLIFVLLLPCALLFILLTATIDQFLPTIINHHQGTRLLIHSHISQTPVVPCSDTQRPAPFFRMRNPLWLQRQLAIPWLEDA